jgi:hypothetical protein
LNLGSQGCFKHWIKKNNIPKHNSISDSKMSQGDIGCTDGLPAQDF